MHVQGSPLKIKIILGSTRPKRFSEHPGRWILGLAEKMDGIEPEVLDLRDYPLPFYEESMTPSDAKDVGHDKEVVRRWAGKIEEGDGFIIVAPEYNHGYPAVLKNALDYVWYPWNRKPVAFVGYGNAGGARSVEQLREVAVELEMVSVRRAVHIFSPYTLVDDAQRLKKCALDSYEKKANGMLKELIEWGSILKTAREQN